MSYLIFFPVCDAHNGWYGDGSTCAQGVAGQYLVGSACQSCPSGHTSNTGAVGLSQCCEYFLKEFSRLYISFFPRSQKKDFLITVIIGFKKHEKLARALFRFYTFLAVCDEDYGWYDNSGTCAQCLAGQFLDVDATGGCQSCPDGKTSYVGAADISQCCEYRVTICIKHASRKIQTFVNFLENGWYDEGAIHHRASALSEAIRSLNC